MLTPTKLTPDQSIVSNNVKKECTIVEIIKDILQFVQSS